MSHIIRVLPKMGLLNGIFVLGLITFLISSTLGLRCYSCSSGDSLEGYKSDSSCGWGKRPNDKLLEECTAPWEPNNTDRLSYACVVLQTNGVMVNENNRRFQGTLRTCAASFMDTELKAMGKKCKQGSLETVIASFKDPTGKAYLTSMANVLDSRSTNVKYCACDSDGCIESPTDLPDSTGNFGNSSGHTISMMMFYRKLLFFVLAIHIGHFYYRWQNM